MIPQKQAEIKEFRAKHGETKIGEINVNMVYGGMRGMKAMVWETSVLDPVEGIRFQGYSIPELQGGVLPTAKEGGEPLPEALFWLLVTVEFGKLKGSWGFEGENVFLGRNMDFWAENGLLAMKTLVFAPKTLFWP